MSKIQTLTNVPLIRKIKKGKRGQIFLVCTIIIIIYMLSFINVVYELNESQYTRPLQIAEFENTYQNFKTETRALIHTVLVNYTQPGTVITGNFSASQIVDQWLIYAEDRMLEKGYNAQFEIIPLLPPTLPVRVAKGNGYASILCNISIYMTCNYLTIDTELHIYHNYEIDYQNSTTFSSIILEYENIYNKGYEGYANVTINGIPAENLYNGTYLHSSPLGSGDIIQAITNENVIITRIV
ncbi:MAG: hypothetical protein U9O98_08965 [Asgard group archaeon]|nr:hypothetical protein [Asgard group archaeon]